MDNIKDRILKLWWQVNRPGVNEVINFLETSDFFEAPSSAKHHLNVVGGLAEHSWNVTDTFERKYQDYLKRGLIPEIPYETRIIVTQGHDWNKINYFKQENDWCSDSQYNFLRNLLTDKKHLLDKDSIAKMLEFCTTDGLKREINSGHATILINWLKNWPGQPFPELPTPPVKWGYDDRMPLGHGEKSVIMLQQFIKLELCEMIAIRWHMGGWDLSPKYGTWAYDVAVVSNPIVTLLCLADMEATHILER